MQRFFFGNSVSWSPSFLLKRYILSGIHDGPHEPFIADSVDFVVGQVHKITLVVNFLAKYILYMFIK